MVPLTARDIEGIVQECVSRRGVADRGALDDARRRVLERITESVRLGPYEGICRPLATDIVVAWSDLLPYLHMSAETMHPFFKPEGEERLIGMVVRARELVADVRRVLADLPGMRDTNARWRTIRKTEQQAAMLEGNIGILRDIASRTTDPRTVSGRDSVGHMVVKTKEFKNLQRTYTELLSIVLGPAGSAFFKEQFEQAERSLGIMSKICDVSGTSPAN